MQLADMFGIKLSDEEVKLSSMFTFFEFTRRNNFPWYLNFLAIGRSNCEEDDDSIFVNDELEPTYVEGTGPFKIFDQHRNCVARVSHRARNSALLRLTSS